MKPKMVGAGHLWVSNVPVMGESMDENLSFNHIRNESSTQITIGIYGITLYPLIL